MTASAGFVQGVHGDGTYRVAFYKSLINCNGTPFQVCQRSIDIRSARSIEQAVATAKALFAERESLPDWFLHADSIQVQTISAAEIAGATPHRRPRAPRARHRPG